jgi:hypothetical protein
VQTATAVTPKSLFQFSLSGVLFIMVHVLKVSLQSGRMNDHAVAVYKLWLKYKSIKMKEKAE